MRPYLANERVPIPWRDENDAFVVPASNSNETPRAIDDPCRTTVGQQISRHRCSATGCLDTLDYVIINPFDNPKPKNADLNPTFGGAHIDDPWQDAVAH